MDRWAGKSEPFITQNEAGQEKQTPPKKNLFIRGGRCPGLVGCQALGVQLSGQELQKVQPPAPSVLSAAWAAWCRRAP